LGFTRFSLFFLKIFNFPHSRARDWMTTTTTDAPEGARTTVPPPPTNRMNPTELMREAERMMERNARARAVREERALDLSGFQSADADAAADDDVVVRGATKPGEDDWAMTTKCGEMVTTRSGGPGGVGSSVGTGDDVDDVDEDDAILEEEEMVEAERRRVLLVEEEFKRGKAALRRRDTKEALARFEAAARACPPESVEVREKLSRTIAQIRELAMDEEVGYGDADAIKDEIAASVRDGDDDGDDVEEERATTPSTQGGDDFFERDAAVSDAGWSEGQSLADDAYRTALWLIESAGEDGPQDIDEIVDLLERARRLCPESRPDAIGRIDALLASMRLQSST